MKKKLLCLLTIMVLAVSAAFVGVAGATFKASAAPIDTDSAIKFEWSMDEGKVGAAGDKACFNIFSGVWGATPQGAPYGFKAGDKLKYDIYVPAAQFETLKTADNKAVTVNDFAFEFLDFQREGGSWDFMGAKDYNLKTTSGEDYKRLGVMDNSMATGGFVTKEVDLTPLAGFNCNFSGYIHFKALNAMAAGSKFTYYMKNIKVVSGENVLNFADATDIKADKNNDGKFEAANEQGNDGFGQYPLQDGAPEWYSVNYSLTISVEENLNVGKISSTFANTYDIPNGSSTATVDFSKITAVDKSGAALATTLKLFNKADNSEIAFTGTSKALEFGNYYVVATAIDTTDNNRNLSVTLPFEVVLLCPKIDNVTLPAAGNTGEVYALPAVEAYDPLNEDTKLNCTVSVKSPIGQAVTLQGTTAKTFVPMMDGEYTVTYSATNANGTTVKELKLNVTESLNVLAVNVAVPTDKMAEGQKKYAAINLFTLSDTQRTVKYSTDYALSYDVYGNSAGVGHIGILTDRGSSTVEGDWEKTDARTEIVKINDSNNKSMAYATDLTAEFSKGWYHREYNLPTFAGESELGGKIMNVAAVISTETATPATISVYFKNVKLINKTTKEVIIDFSANAGNYERGGVLGEDGTIAGGNLAKKVGGSFDPVVAVTKPSAIRGVAFNKSDITFSAMSSVTVTKLKVLNGDTEIAEVGGKYTLPTTGDYKITANASYTLGDKTFTFNLEEKLTAAKYNVLPTVTITGDYGEYNKGAEVTLLDFTATNPIGETLTKETIVKKGTTVIDTTGGKFTLSEYGVYTISHKATDIDGNSNEEVVTIRPKDITAPVLSGGTLAANYDTGTEIEIPTLTASDDKDTELVVKVKIFKNDVVVEADYTAAKYTFATAGTYKFEFSTVDSSGNESNKITLTTTVSDKAAPPPSGEDTDKSGCGTVGFANPGSFIGGGMILLAFGALMFAILKRKSIKG